MKHLKFSIPLSLIMWALFIWAALSLFGCATIKAHPVVTGVTFAIVAGSIAASQHHDNRVSSHTMSGIVTPNCAATPSLCQ